MSNKTSSDKISAIVEELKFTRDFGLYLDTLNKLKSEYMIILCIKNTSGQNISESVAEKIRRLGFQNYTAEPDMKYAGISYNGRIVYDGASGTDKPPYTVDVNAQQNNFCVSFEGKEAEIKINGADQSLNDRGINIAVYDCKKSELTDISSYDASENNPSFFHRNFYYTKEYIDSHIFVIEEYKKSVTLPLRRSYFSNRRLGVKEVERGIFLPNKNIKWQTHGGVCDENFNFIAGHQLHNPKTEKYDDRHIWGSYEAAREDIAYIDETVLYGGTMLEHPGHLIVECFADRTWWLLQNIDSNIRIAVEPIIEWRDETSFIEEIFDAFGISKERLIFIDRPTQFKKIIVPDQASVPYGHCFPYEFTSEYIKPFRHITSRLTPGKYKKIYLTKTNTSRKNFIGEEFFIDFFEKKGFKVIHPEEYTMKEKAELMYGADEVVTIDSTNDHFTVFCKPTVKFTILIRTPEYWDIAQQLVNESVGIKDVYLVNVSGSFLTNFSETKFLTYAVSLSLIFATEDFRKYVREVYNEELDITPLESLKSCIFDYLSCFPDYYSEPRTYLAVKDIRMIDIMRGLSAAINDKGLDTRNIDPVTSFERRFYNIKRRLQEETELNSKKIEALSEKAKEYIQENADLRRYAAQLEAENQQLREKNSEMEAYMAEISSLLDALEAGAQSEE